MHFIFMHFIWTFSAKFLGVFFHFVVFGQCIGALHPKNADVY